MNVIQNPRFIFSYKSIKKKNESYKRERSNLTKKNFLINGYRAESVMHTVNR